MKLQENTWYYHSNDLREALQNNTLPQDTTSRNLTPEECQEIKDIVEKDDMKHKHRCIIIYRDAVVIDSVVYAFCLSCGDAVVDGKHQPLDRDTITKLLNFR